MIKTFLISDSHFGHANILKYEKTHRPFNSIEEMNDVLVEKWNSVVGENDRVFYLGDFCFKEKNLSIAALLKGKKYLIAGNHDMLATEKYLKYFHKVLGAIQYKDCILTHIPVHPGQFYRYKYNIHGHTHSTNIDDPRYINVSTEVLNHTPIEFDELINTKAPSSKRLGR